jgi:hypothetical protein
MSDDINKKQIEKKMSLLEKIYFDDSDKYTNKERAEAAQKHRTLGELIGDDTVLVGPSKKTPIDKPGARRAKKRGTFEMGGLLEDERVGYADGTPDDKLLGHIEEVTDEMREELLNNNRRTKEFVTKEYGLDPDGLEMEIKNFQEKEEKNNKVRTEQPQQRRYQNAEGGNIDGQMSMLMIPKEPQDDMMPEEEMLPDDEMEDEYLDFILDEALDSEEEDYLMSQLQDNERLSEIFDKVIDIAQEFAGSGPVEGPGSGVSDSIPARLSDGEFVFTAKAVDEIGADKLMAMMKDAEMKADDRQGLANGGEPEEEDTVEMPVEKPATKQDIRVVKTTIDNGGKGLLDEDEISKSIKSKMMLDNRTGRHVQS